MTLRIAIDWERRIRRTQLFDLLIVNFAMKLSIDNKLNLRKVDMTTFPSRCYSLF